MQLSAQLLNRYAVPRQNACIGGAINTAVCYLASISRFEWPSSLRKFLHSIIHAYACIRKWHEFCNMSAWRTSPCSRSTNEACVAIHSRQQRSIVHPRIYNDNIWWRIRKRRAHGKTKTTKASRVRVQTSIAFRWMAQPMHMFLVPWNIWIRPLQQCIECSTPFIIIASTHIRTCWS